MICSDCGKEITSTDKAARGPDGEVHYACFKRGTAQGKEVSLMSLHQELGALKRRVQDLERRLTRDERDIPFRIGGSS